jgi:uncharacterized protein
MRMKRTLMQNLKDWQVKSVHLPLLLRGARQVGKTYLIEQFGQGSFNNMISINFEFSPEFKACFTTLKPQEIINGIEIISKQRVIPGTTLLFLDEIQLCPNAIMALRYFKEQLPELHVIGAGSLLEFALSEKNMHMPVGRVQYIHLKPLSFIEYLQATNDQPLLEWIAQVTLNDDISDLIHNMALQRVREYMLLGGMPMVLNGYLQTKSMAECQAYQTLLLRTYSDDFSKYAATARHKYLQQVYNRTPGLVGQQIKYVNLSQEMDSRYLKSAIEDLKKAGVIYPVYATSAVGLPLLTHLNEKKFKLLFLDVGLMKRAAKLDVELLLTHDIMLLNRGAIAQQLVGQELLAYQDPLDEPQLYFWNREEKSSTAEVDYLLNFDAMITPIEVKAGKTGSLKSLHLFMKEKKIPLGVRISSKKLEMNDHILSVPFYLISQLQRILSHI